MVLKFPHDVNGWLSEIEGNALYVFAWGKRVLEIGAYEGRSTICLAQSAKHVVSVDPHDGRGTPEPRDTLPALEANLERYGVADRVTIEWPLTDDGSLFDLVFIDGAHDYDSVCADINIALPRLAPYGLLAFHDYQHHEGESKSRFEPGVTAAVHDILARDCELLVRYGLVAIVAPQLDMVTT